MTNIRLAAVWLALLSAACRQSSADAGPSPSASAPAHAAPSASAALHPVKRCPAGMVQIEAFCIDRFEAHLAESDGRPHSPYERPRPDRTYRARSQANVVPQAYISRLEAAAACEASNKRLCRAREWYRACAGSRSFRFPYGNQEQKGRCNTGKGPLLTKLFGRVPLTYDAHYNNPRLNQEPGFLSKTGAYEECRSEAGVRDLVGNLHEWVADDVSARLLKEIPLEKGDQWLGKRGMGVFMGGYFSSKAEHGHGCLYVTATHAPDYHDYSTGFRCCSSL